MENMNNNLKQLRYLYSNTIGTDKMRVFDKLLVSNDIETLRYLYSNTIGTDKMKVFDKLLVSNDIETLRYLYSNTIGTDKMKVFDKLLVLNEVGSPNNSPIDLIESGVIKGIKTDKKYRSHFFICHASEDKTSIARPLALELEKRNFKVWYDEYTLTLGDSLRRKIDEGLSTSQYGIVILSHYFFQKEWPQKELDALVGREDGKGKVILPIWHNIVKKDIIQYSPLLSDKLAVSSSKGIAFITDEIIKACPDLY